MECTIQIYKGDEVGTVSLIEKVPQDAELMVIIINPNGVIDSCSYENKSWQDNGGTIVVNAETCVYGVTDLNFFKNGNSETLNEWFQYYDGELYGCSDWSYLLKKREDVENPAVPIIVLSAE